MRSHAASATARAVAAASSPTDLRVRASPPQVRTRAGHGRRPRIEESGTAQARRPVRRSPRRWKVSPPGPSETGALASRPRRRARGARDPGAFPAASRRSPARKSWPGGRTWRGVGHGGNNHLVAVPQGVFLDDHRVGAGGNRRAGENPHRLSRLDDAGEAPARRAFADDLQPSRSVGGAHRPAVHGRSGEGGLVAGGDDIGGQDPAQGLGQRDCPPPPAGHNRQHPRARRPRPRAASRRPPVARGAAALFHQPHPFDDHPRSTDFSMS